MHMKSRSITVSLAFALLAPLACCAPAVAFAADQQATGDLVPGATNMTAEPDGDDDAAAVEPTPLYRIYNIRSGEHFYTASTAERDYLVKIGWFDEGTGWVAPSVSDAPVYRLYNPNAGDHHYTTSAEERDMLVKLGWNDEGVGWYSVDGAMEEDEQAEEPIPVYRQYNPNAIAGAHNFTTSKEENDQVVRAGWNEEGIAWYALGEGVSGGDMWLSPAHLVGIADGIPLTGSVTTGYRTSVSAENMAALNARVSTGVEVAFLALNARTGESVAFCPDSRFYGASTIKAPYIAALCKYSAPGVEGYRDTMYDVITYSDNYGFNLLSERYGTFYEQAFANEWGVWLDFKYGGTYVDLTPRELAKLWIGVRDYIISDGLHVGMFRGLFGNGGYFKTGDMDEAGYGRNHHLAGVEGDVVYAIMTRYAYEDPVLWGIRDDLVRALS